MKCWFHLILVTFQFCSRVKLYTLLQATSTGQQNHKQLSVLITVSINNLLKQNKNRSKQFHLKKMICPIHFFQLQNLFFPQLFYFPFLSHFWVTKIRFQTFYFHSIRVGRVSRSFNLPCHQSKICRNFSPNLFSVTKQLNL